MSDKRNFKYHYYLNLKNGRVARIKSKLRPYGGYNGYYIISEYSPIELEWIKPELSEIMASVLFSDYEYLGSIIKNVKKPDLKVD